MKAAEAKPAARGRNFTVCEEELEFRDFHRARPKTQTKRGDFSYFDEKQ